MKRRSKTPAPASEPTVKQMLKSVAIAPTLTRKQQRTRRQDRPGQRAHPARS